MILFFLLNYRGFQGLNGFRCSFWHSMDPAGDWNQLMLGVYPTIWQDFHHPEGDLQDLSISISDGNEEANLLCTKWTAGVRRVTSESGFDIQQPIEVDKKGHPVNSFRHFLFERNAVIPTLSGLSIKQKTRLSAPRLFKKPPRNHVSQRYFPSTFSFEALRCPSKKHGGENHPPWRFQDESCSECQEHLEPGLRVFFQGFWT